MARSATGAVTGAVTGAPSARAGPFLAALAMVWIAVCFVLALGAPARAASPELVLRGPVPNEVTVRHVDHFVDADWTMTVERALGEAADDFTPLREKSIDFGYTKSRIWLRVRLVNATEDVREWRLFFAENFKQVFDVYLARPNGTGEEESGEEGAGGFDVETVMSLGPHSPFSARPIAYPELTAPLDLAPGEEVTVLISIWSEGSSYIEFSVETRDSFDAMATDRLARNFVFYGAMTLLIVIALAALVFLRRPVFLAYSGYALCALLYVMHAEGTTFQYLWPDAPRLNSMASVYTGAGIIVFGAVFARLFLRTRALHPFVDKVLLGVIAWTLGACAVLIPLDPQILKKLLIFTSFIAICTFTWAGIVAARVRFRRVRFYLLAWVGALVSAAMLNLNHLFGVSISQDTLYDSMRAVMVFDAAMMGLAIADGFNQLRQSRQSVLESNLRETSRNLELNRRLSALEAQYHAMADLARAEGAARLDAVHDLRTPLNALRTNVENMLRARPERGRARTGGATGATDTERNVEETFDYLEALMRSMLDAQAPPIQALPVQAPSAQAPLTRDDSRRAAESAPRPAVRLDRVIERAHEMFASDAEEKGLTLTLDIEADGAVPPSVPEAALDVLRIVSNLVSNAIRYTAVGGVTLSLRPEEGGAGGKGARVMGWVVTVADTGPGLPPGQFEGAPTQHDGTDAEDGPGGEHGEGHGLGLAIARNLAAQHGWSLAHLPRSGGTTIELRLPLLPDDAASPVADAIDA